jgi:hypothetical protein
MLLFAHLSLRKAWPRASATPMAPISPGGHRHIARTGLRLTARCKIAQYFSADCCATFPTEVGLYCKFGLSFIEPELREGHDEVKHALEGAPPLLMALKDIRGELTHSLAPPRWPGLRSPISTNADSAREFAAHPLRRRSGEALRTGKICRP